MITRPLLILSASFVLGFAAYAADTGPTNDTHTRLLSKASDCGVVNVREAYFTEFGDHGGAGKAAVIKAVIRNDGYDKKVELSTSVDPFEVANTSSSYWQYAVSIAYETQSNGFDQVTLIDQRVGPEMDKTFWLKVTMNGRTHTCSAIRVGK